MTTGLKRIVVAVDGSPVSVAPLQQAVWLAQQTRASLTGVFVVDTQWADFIGNDWQSSRNARQGFLDYLRREQEQQAELACRQFESHSRHLFEPVFLVQAGDPTAVLLTLATAADTEVLLLSRRVFQVCGRPSSKALAQQLCKRATQPIWLWP
jgi:nucleotide-binding universal stress UspA family protein